MEHPPRKRLPGEELLRSFIEARWSKFLSGKLFYREKA
jgi:hypothetical protein